MRGLQGVVMEKHKLIRALAALLACGAPVSFAQSVDPGLPGDIGQRGEQILREREELERARQRALERERQRPDGIELGELAPTPATEDDGRCLEVKRLELVGARLLPAETREAVRDDVTGRCLGAVGINSLLKRITAAYVDLGYVTTRAYVPPQQSADGTLTIVVIEGTIEAIELVPPGSASLATAFPSMVGEVFDLRAAEQGLDQLNRLRSNDARLDIQPGSTPGASVLRVLNQTRRRWFGSLGTDNNGSPETGEIQATASFSAEDPLGLNDSLIVSYTRSVEEPREGAYSGATFLSYSVPYGWWTASLSASQADYASVVEGITRDFRTSGRSRTVSLRGERVAFRDRTRKLTLYTSLNYRDGENFIAGQLIEASSRTQTVLDLSANLSLAAGGALWSFDAGIERGMPWFGGASDADHLPGDVPHAQFTKYTFGAGINTAFDARGTRLSLSSSLRGQWTSNTLYTGDQITITGPFAVRGYRDVRVYADRGVVWRNELSSLHRLGGKDQGAAWVVKPFVGLDVGRSFAHGGRDGATLSGVAAGTAVMRGPFALQLSYSTSGPASDGIASDHSFFARLDANF